MQGSRLANVTAEGSMAKTWCLASVFSCMEHVQHMPASTLQKQQIWSTTAYRMLRAACRLRPLQAITNNCRHRRLPTG